MSSARNASPGTSTPSQNDEVPSRIAPPESRKRPSSESRESSPCTSMGQRFSAPRARNSEAMARTSRWLVNSTNIPPSLASARSCVRRASAEKWPAASTFGGGTSRAMARMACSRYRNGDA